MLEIGPLVLFFFTNSKFGIFSATAASWLRCWIALRCLHADAALAIMPVVTAVVVLVFGGPTFVLHDDLFIKLKPTIIYFCSAGCCWAALRSASRCWHAVRPVFQLTEEGWQKLTLRWALFFFALAVLNEIVWRTQTTDFWVSFKVFGVMPLTFVFARCRCR